MGRPNTTGLTYLVGRPDSGKYSYHRVLPGDIAPFVTGEIKLDWGTKPHRLDGKAAIKISLKTGDTETARTRWAPVHAQVQALVVLAERRVRMGPSDGGKKPVMVAGLSQEDIQRLAGQVHYDILDADDETWKNSAARSPVEDVLRIIAASNGKTFIPDEARDVAHKVARRNAEAMLKDSGRPKPFEHIEESEFEFGPEYIQVQDAVHDGKPVEKVIFWCEPERRWWEEGKTANIIPSDASAILHKNGIDLPPDHPDRKQLALEVLRQKVSALRIVEARRRNADTTMTQPRPPVMAGAGAKTRRQDAERHAPEVDRTCQTWRKSARRQQTLFEFLHRKIR
jgi:hypothetical protein